MEPKSPKPFQDLICGESPRPSPFWDRETRMAITILVWLSLILMGLILGLSPQ